MTNFAQDMAVKQALGFSLTHWNSMREHERAYYRQNVTTAPHFQENQ